MMYRLWILAWTLHLNQSVIKQITLPNLIQNTWIYVILQLIQVFNIKTIWFIEEILNLDCNCFIFKRNIKINKKRKQLKINKWNIMRCYMLIGCCRVIGNIIIFLTGIRKKRKIMKLILNLIRLLLVMENCKEGNIIMIIKMNWIPR